MRVHVFLCICVCVCVCVCMCAHVHACVQWCVHECACMCVRLPSHIHTSEEFFNILLDQQVLSILLCLELDSLWSSLHLLFRALRFLLAAALLQTPERSDYHPSTLSPVVSFLSLTRILLPGTTSPFLSICYSVSSFKSSRGNLSLWPAFTSGTCMDMCVCISWVCAPVCACMFICAFETLLSKYVWVKV